MQTKEKKKPKPLAPAHFVRQLDASIQCNLSAQHVAYSKASLKSGSVQGLITRLEKCSTHEGKMLTTHHERLAEAVKAFADHGKYLHQLRHVKSLIVALTSTEGHATHSVLGDLACKTSVAMSLPVPLQVISCILESGVQETFVAEPDKQAEILAALYHKDTGIARFFYCERAAPQPWDEAAMHKWHSDCVTLATTLALGHYAEGAAEPRVLVSFYKWLQHSRSSCALTPAASLLLESLGLMACVAAAETPPDSASTKDLLACTEKLGELRKTMDSYRLGRTLKTRVLDFVEKAEEDRRHPSKNVIVVLSSGSSLLQTSDSFSFD